jgi:filamentous hemagglutinin family protein
MAADKFRIKQVLYAGAIAGCCTTLTAMAGGAYDGTMGPTTEAFSGNFQIPHTNGTLTGTNLFHSFGGFRIDAGESATFTGPGSVVNVISRVTGTDPSTFNGPLTALIDLSAPGGPVQTGANFYFINPNGIIFKEGANLNIGGAFTATTSNFVTLGQDGVYYADPGMQSVLTSSPPSAFGFLDSNPGEISFEGTQMVKYINLNPATPAFSFIGGDISVDEASEGTATNFGTETSRGTFLTGNRIELVSVGSAGEAASTSGAYDLSSFSALGNIEIKNGSVIDATEVYIRGGQVVINDSVVAPGFFYVADMGPPPNGGSITISGSESVDITGTGTPLQIEVDHPDPNIDPIVVTRFDGGPLFTGVSTFGGNPFPNNPPTDVPDVLIEGGDVTIADSAGIISQRFGPGEAGDITVTGDTVSILNGSLIVNLNTYAGAGGDITVDASQVIIDNEGNTTPITGITGITASSNFSPVFGDPTLDPDFDGSAPPNLFLIYAADLASADAGNITVNATGEGLTIRGADITTESRSYGKAGDITVNASNIILSREGGESGSIASQSGFAGDAGNIDINATGNIDLIDGYVISASTSGTGTGGGVSLTAGNAITISGTNAGQGSSGIGSSTVLPPPQLEALLASLYGFPDFPTMAGTFTGNPDAGLFDVLGALQMMGLTDLDGANPVAGNAGAIVVSASQLSIAGEHAISSSTSSDGNGGAIDIQVDSLALSDNAEIRSRSGLYDEQTGELLVGTGNGGDINIVSSNNISMTSDSSISASSLGDGLAGNIAIDAGQQLNMTDSSISTQATVSDGGNIDIQAVEMIYLDQSEITTSVESGVGGGGNINIDPDFVILKSSSILANAYGGPGGNINIIAGNFIATPDSVVDASSALGIDGTVNISSPDEEVSEDLAVLPDNFLDVTSLISERCGTPSGGSSLVDAGPGGLTIDPDGYLPSYATATDLDYEEEKEGESNTVSGNHWWAPYSHQSSLQIAQLTCSR